MLMETKKKITLGWVTAGCSGLLVLLSLGSAAFWGYHVAQDRGAISADEALPGVISSCCCSLLSVALVGLGVFIALRARKAIAQGAPPST